MSIDPIAPHYASTTEARVPPVDDFPYVRLTVPVSFANCATCKGWLMVVDGGFARAAPSASVLPPCACSKPVVPRRRETHVTSIMTKAEIVPEVEMKS